MIYLRNAAGAKAHEEQVDQLISYQQAHPHYMETAVPDRIAQELERVIDAS